MALSRFKKLMQGKNQNDEDENVENNWIAYGLLFGVVLGVLTGNFGLWVAVGIAIGAGMASQQSKKSEDAGEEKK